MIKAEKAKEISTNAYAKRSAKYYIQHISQRIDRAARQGSSSIEMELSDFADFGLTLQQYAEILMLIGMELQANGYRTTFDNHRELVIRW